ncbi:MAG: hypothetical protein LIP12_00045 [Clostridiales bacterium]|nr:hypothetical protein [Clostridiales bacterium]
MGNEVYSKSYWNKFFTKMAMYLAIIAMAAILLGTLAMPVVLSVVYSVKWMFLYPVYLILSITILCFIGKLEPKEDKKS